MRKRRNLPAEMHLSVESDIYGPPAMDIRKIKNRVYKGVDSPDKERKLYYMKSKKKTLLIAAAAMLVLGITAFATSGIVTSWNASSSSVPEYTSLPSAERVINDIGYKPVLIDTFGNGYKFYEGSVIKNHLDDENGNTMEKFKSVIFRYEKNGDKVLFSQERFNSQMEQEGAVFNTVDNIDIYYDSYTNKIVPPDYKMTEEDKRAEENGELVFSWGSDKVSISKMQSVSWTKNGLHCSLLQIDGKLKPEELADMAAEAIKK